MESSLRVGKAAFDHRYKAKIPGYHCLIDWLIEHITDVYNKRPNGDDNKSPDSRNRGEDPSARMLPFGEQVLYMPSKVSGPANNMDEKFKNGIWAGVNEDSGESLILTEGGAVLARTVNRIEDDRKYNLDLLNKVRGRSTQHKEK